MLLSKKQTIEIENFQLICLIISHNAKVELKDNNWPFQSLYKDDLIFCFLKSYFIIFYTAFLGSPPPLYAFPLMLKIPFLRQEWDFNLFILSTISLE